MSSAAGSERYAAERHYARLYERAPRPFLAIAGQADDRFPRGAVREAFARVQRVNAAAGVPERGERNLADLVGEFMTGYYKFNGSTWERCPPPVRARAATERPSRP